MLYRDWRPSQKGANFRPSVFAIALSTFGTLSEFAFPLLCLLGRRHARVGVFVALGFHIFILSNVAMGVPQVDASSPCVRFRKSVCV